MSICLCINFSFASIPWKLEDERRRAKAIGCKSGAEEGRSLGALLGLAIGDALGGPLEFHPARYGSTELHTLGQEDIWGQAPTWTGKVGEGQKKEWNSAFNVKPGQWTDDTSMALCLADSLPERYLRPGVGIGIGGRT